MMVMVREDWLVNYMTSRQRDVSALIACGMSDNEIAEQLHISRAWVRNNIKGAMHCLGVKRRVSIAVFMLTGCLPRESYEK